MTAPDLLVDLARRRVTLGLSQRDVAEQMGSSQPSVARFERSSADPKLSTVLRYADAVRARVVVATEEHPESGVLADGRDAHLWADLRHGLALVVTGGGPAATALLHRGTSLLGRRGTVHVIDLVGVPVEGDVTTTRAGAGDLVAAHAVLRDHDPRRPDAATAEALVVVGVEHLDPIGLRQVQLAARARPVLATLSRPSAMAGFELLADTAELLACVPPAGTVDRARLAGAMATHAGLSADDVLALLEEASAAGSGAVASGGRLVVGRVHEAAGGHAVQGRPVASRVMQPAVPDPDSPAARPSPGAAPPSPAAPSSGRGVMPRLRRTAQPEQPTARRPAAPVVVAAAEVGQARRVAARLATSHRVVDHATVGATVPADVAVTAPLDPTVLDRLLSDAAVLLVAVDGTEAAALRAATLVDGLRRPPAARAAVNTARRNNAPAPDGLQVISLTEVTAFADRPAHAPA